jgi:hypothetical protein
MKEILEKLKLGDLELDEAVSQLKNYLFEDIGHTRIDHNREERTGAAEVIYGQSKTSEQILEITERMIDQNSNVLITRVKKEKIKPVLKKYPEAIYYDSASICSVTINKPIQSKNFIAIVSAGTSDQDVAHEAKVTAEFYGNRVFYVTDCGVAGLHRLMSEIDEIRKASVVIAIAGMEGALSSVIAGQVSIPVIAVPTSVGYGASFNGLAALLAMMNSCASGVSVVNIDNGFGAAYQASMINRMLDQKPLTIKL